MFMNFLRNYETRLADRRYIIAAILAFILCMVGFGLLRDYLGAEMLDLLPYYDRATLEGRILEYAPAAREAYAIATLTLDGLFPLAYGFIFAALLHWLIGRTHPMRILALLVLIPMVLDWSENVQFSLILQQFPDISDAQVMLASYTTMFKWYTLRSIQALIVIVALVRLGRWALVKLRN